MKRRVGNFEFGQRVKILHAVSPVTGRVVEHRGPLGPKGAQVYRILLRRRPRPAYVEVLESQLEPVARVPA